MSFDVNVKTKTKTATKTIDCDVEDCCAAGSEVNELHFLRK